MRKILRYMKPYKWLVLISILAIFVNVMTQMYLPNLMADIVDNGVLKGDYAYIYQVGARMLVVTLIGTLVMIGGSYLSASISMKIGSDLRQDVFTKVENYSLREYNLLGTSSLITRTTNDVTQIQQLFLMGLRMMVRAPLMFIGGVIMAIENNPRLSFLFFLTMPAVVLFIYIIGKKAIPLFRIVQTKIDNLNRVLRENITGIRVVRAFDKNKAEAVRFDAANQDLTKTNLQVSRLMALMMPGVNLIMNLIVVFITYLAASQIDIGNMQVGDLMAFILYINMVLFSIIMLSMIFVMIPRAEVSAIRINEVLEQPASLVNPNKPKEIPDITCCLEFDDVSFSYPNSKINSLCGISFQAKQGEVTAIVGGTGSGKTTLLNLIPRFYDVSQGAIRFCGVDIRDLGIQDLRARIGLIPQKVSLFSGTIRDNIQKGKPTATEEEIWQALKIAQAAEFVKELPEGLDTYVAQGGKNFSGGQKQRLSIARAMIRKPQIYLFDDSFSALDFKTDAKLRKALHEKIENALILVVAQRISSIMDADRIIVLQDGMVEGVGTHQELLRTSQVYRETYDSQMRKEDDNGAE